MKELFWNGNVHSCIAIIYIQKMGVHLKALYRLDAISFKIPFKIYFMEVEKKLKIHLEMQKNLDS